MAACAWTDIEFSDVTARVAHGLDSSMDWIGFDWIDWVRSPKIIFEQLNCIIVEADKSCCLHT